MRKIPIKKDSALYVERFLTISKEIFPRYCGHFLPFSPPSHFFNPIPACSIFVWYLK